MLDPATVFSANGLEVRVQGDVGQRFTLLMVCSLRQGVREASVWKKLMSSAIFIGPERHQKEDVSQAVGFASLQLRGVG